ncbi:phosphonate transport system substrate-binding protein [Natronocella acetinitrilica]|uniref:Phosphonate transport system substrate-binding protein n=1 Tax=Natronocella acetinitrilica TaxID=414046 RepID=A0AAE3KCC0_9GAMM|nr:PhnD/SsuA/transferrin family substrate-binding protein [Natronocella acetinitrilica]MCP1676700.1 phosphonate transport system substrate-binding protein [Natronocella acetinitrilica]
MFPTGNAAERECYGSVTRPKKRARLWALLLCLALSVVVQPVTASERPLRIGLTPVMLEDQVRFLDRWRGYLEQRLGREVQFLRRNSYGEVIELALRGRIDFAWLCGFPYYQHRDALDLLLTPLYNGEPLYRSYLIVPASDLETGSLLDLQGGIFAYADPNSNSGWLYPEYVLRQAGSSGEQHFQRTFYTWGHQRVVEAVAGGLAEGGAVDGYVWDTLSRIDPELTARTRIVSRSEPFGFPPIVATSAADTSMRDDLRAVLLGMGDDPVGRELLERLNLDGFTQVNSDLYDAIGALSREVAGHR